MSKPALVSVGVPAAFGSEDVVNLRRHQGIDNVEHFGLAHARRQGVAFGQSPGDVRLADCALPVNLREDFRSLQYPLQYVAVEPASTDQRRVRPFEVGPTSPFVNATGAEWVSVARRDHDLHARTGDKRLRRVAWRDAARKVETAGRASHSAPRCLAGL